MTEQSTSEDLESLELEALLAAGRGIPFVLDNNSANNNTEDILKQNSEKGVILKQDYFQQDIFNNRNSTSSNLTTTPAVIKDMNDVNAPYSSIDASKYFSGLKDASSMTTDYGYNAAGEVYTLDSGNSTSQNYYQGNYNGSAGNYNTSAESNANYFNDTAGAHTLNQEASISTPPQGAYDYLTTGSSNPLFAPFNCP